MHDHGQSSNSHHCALVATLQFLFASLRSCRLLEKSTTTHMGCDQQASICVVRALVAQLDVLGMFIDMPPLAGCAEANHNEKES